MKLYLVSELYIYAGTLPCALGAPRIIISPHMAMKDSKSAKKTQIKQTPGNIDFVPNINLETVPCVRTLYAGTLPSFC